MVVLCEMDCSSANFSMQIHQSTTDLANFERSNQVCRPDLLDGFDLKWFDLSWVDWTAVSDLDSMCRKWKNDWLIWFDLIWSDLIWFKLSWVELIDWFDLIWSDLDWLIDSYPSVLSSNSRKGTFPSPTSLRHPGDGGRFKDPGRCSKAQGLHRPTRMAFFFQTRFLFEVRMQKDLEVEC